MYSRLIMEPATFMADVVNGTLPQYDLDEVLNTLASNYGFDEESLPGLLRSVFQRHAADVRAPTQDRSNERAHQLADLVAARSS